MILWYWVAVWRSSNALVSTLDQRSWPTLSPVSTGMGDRVRVRLTEAALYFGMWPATQVDSAFYPLWNGRMSTSQRAMMLCGWEGNRRPGGKLWQPTAGWMTYSHLRAEPVHRDHLRAQRSVTSTGSLYFFYYDNYYAPRPHASS